MYNKMRLKGLFVLSVMILIIIGINFLAGCATAPSQSQRAEEIKNSEQGTAYHIKYFVERANINRKQEIFDNPAQVSWIYCLADNGQVVFYGSVLGKVTSSEKRLEPKTYSTDSDLVGNYLNYDGILTNEVLQQDGTFGNSDSYVYWFDPDGNYYQWGGNYFLTTIPIAIEESVLNVREVNK